MDRPSLSYAAKPSRRSERRPEPHCLLPQRGVSERVLAADAIPRTRASMLSPSPFCFSGAAMIAPMVRRGLSDEFR
jgi:hypothetical protein